MGPSLLSDSLSASTALEPATPCQITEGGQIIAARPSYTRLEKPWNILRSTLADPFSVTLPMRVSEMMWSEKNDTIPCSGAKRSKASH